MTPPRVHERPPLLFVTHLPSASSFYASILQPLGLQFLSSPPIPPSQPPTPAILNYGYLQETPAGLKKVVVFGITQAISGTVGVVGRLRLSANSEEAVREFYAKCGVVNRGGRNSARIEYLPAIEQHIEGEVQGGEGIRASTRDFDGNMIEAVYRVRDRGGRGIETASSEREARRVLEWQEQVAKSIAEGSVVSGAGGGSEAGYRTVGRPEMVRRSDSYPIQGSERPLRLVRRETVTTEHYRRPDERGGEGRGISGKAVIGTLLGAAAGAVFAYAMVRSESPERVPIAPRRASYGNGPHYTHVSRSPVVERVIPARSYVSGRDERPRYVEYDGPRVKEIEEKSYVSQRQGRGSQVTASRTRSRSEVGPRYEHRPLTILPAQSVSRARSPGSHLSQRSSYKTAESRRERSPSRTRKSGSHVSSRSYHSHSTAKPSPPPAVSRSTTTIRVVPERERRVMHSGLEREVERRSSIVERARQVPLPMSVVGGMGYAASVAPSDSVSSVGTKRERERLRERMSARGW